MPNADFFARLGLFVRTNFLDNDLCAQLRAEIQALSATPATVLQEKGLVVNEEIRRATLVTVSSSTQSLIEARLLALRQQIEGHFQVVLQGCVTPQFLRYRKGDFYVAHRDNGLAKQRQISVIVFLNDHVPRHQELDFYAGGVLTFYRLIDDNPRWTNVRLPLTPEEGLLIAFRSQVVHEVTPVTRGERYTIVNWFF